MGIIKSRDRLKISLEHREPDRVPVDFGGSAVTGINVGIVYGLRQALKLDKPNMPVKVIEPFQMLGEIKTDLMEALGVDVLPLTGQKNLFGYKNENWKEWKTFEGTPVLVPEKFNTDPDSNGDILMYPEGDKSAHASGRMPKGGFYFDAIIRQPAIDDEKLNVEDNLEEFNPISDNDLEYFRINTERIYNETDKAILASFGGTAFGDIALVPATWLKNPKGIRDVAEWYMSTIIRKDYIYNVFSKQCDIGLANLKKIFSVVGDKISVVFLSGADFGTQTSSFISPEAYKSLYMPFHKKINDWIHTNTKWKTFMHSCGAISNLIEFFIEAGFDVLNPVQCSATNMEPSFFKEEIRQKHGFLGWWH